MINKKFCITMSGFMIASLMLTGCSSMFGNPMKYVISQDETRQEQTESQNDTGNNDTSSDEQISSEEDNDNQGGQHHQGLVPALMIALREEVRHGEGVYRDAVPPQTAGGDEEVQVGT